MFYAMPPSIGLKLSLQNRLPIITVCAEQGINFAHFHPYQPRSLFRSWYDLTSAYELVMTLFIWAGPILEWQRARCNGLRDCIALSGNDLPLIISCRADV